MLIVFEGIDGCGKGTQVGLLRDHIQKESTRYEVVMSKTPGATKFGNFTRDVLFQTVTTHELEPETASLMCFCSHLESVSKIIEPALMDGKIVISDRWDAYSGIAYGIHGGVRPIHQEIQKLRQNAGPEPDLIFHLHGDPEVFLPRAQSSRRTETHQDGKVWNTIEKQRRIQEEYFSIFHQGPLFNRWLSPSATLVQIKSDDKSVAEIADIVWTHAFKTIRRHFDL